MSDLLIIDAGGRYVASWKWEEADGDDIAAPYPTGWTARCRLGRWLNRPADLELAAPAAAGSCTVADTGFVVVTLEPAATLELLELGRWFHFRIELFDPEAPDEPVPFLDGLANVLGGVLASA